MEPRLIGIPAVVLYKIEHGTMRSGNPPARRRDLQRLVSVNPVLPLGRKAAERVSWVRRDPEQRGERIGPLNLLIAGTTLAFGCTLVTHNTAELSRVPGLEIEAW